MPLYLINPGGRTVAKSRKRRTAAQRRATQKMLAANKRRRGTTRRRASAGPRRRESAKVVVIHNPGGSPVAKRRRVKRRATARRASVTRRKRRTIRRNPPARAARRRRRSFRRNPPVMAILRSSLMDGAAGLAGSIVSGKVAGMIEGALSGTPEAPKTPDKAVLSAADLAVGVGVAVVAGMAKFPPGVARAIAQGAMQRALGATLKRHLPAETSQALGLGEDMTYGLTPGGGIPGAYGVAAYPERPMIGAGNGIAAYPGYAPLDVEDFSLSG